MTEIEFAQHCARLAALASKWAADALDTRGEDVSRRADREPVERFIKDVRERLDYMEKKL